MSTEEDESQKHKVSITFHYFSNDPQFKWEYHSVEVHVNGVLTKKYGSYYFDKGGVQAESYAQGYAYAIGKDKVEITRTNIADIKTP